MVKAAFIRKLVNPVAISGVMRSKRFSHFNEMRKLQWLSLEENQMIQRKKLYEIVKYSDQNLPYYSDLIRKENIAYSEETIFEDIRKFPPLTKDLIRKNYDKLTNFKIKRKWRKDTSGGSTGEPILLYHDQVFSDYGAASKILFNEWAGRKEGELMVKLWGSEKEILEGGEGLRGVFVRHGMNTIILNAFRMSKEDMLRYVKIINQKKPKMILGYTQSLGEISRFIKHSNISVYSPEGIMASAGTLTPDMKKLISETFRANVYNRYGSREVGDMACSCEKDEGLHLNIFNHYIEILDDKMKPCKPGKMGKVYVTSLHNQVMPLIRYEIGDIAVPAKNPRCSCGRGMPLIEKVVGRTVNVFRTKNGELIDGEYFTHLFYFRDWVEKFQVVQKDYSLIEIKIVLRGERNKADEKYIISAIRKVMGEKCNINFSFVDDVRPTKSGKFLYTVSRLT